jgi:dienelactone hydrolase
VRAAAALVALIVALMVASGASAASAQGTAPERIAIPSLASAREAGAPETLSALLFRPAGAGPFAALVALHGCGGLYTNRTRGTLDGRFADWGARLSALGYVVLFPDSFGPRGLREICSLRDPPIDPTRGRPEDAEAALAWLAHQPFVHADRVGVIGWSNGAMTALALVDPARPRPPGVGVDFRTAIAFYPGCRGARASGGWTTRMPLAILIGDADNWSSPGPCRDLAAAAAARGAPVEFTLYPGANHDFDHPDLPTRVRANVAGTRSGTATLGTDPAARADALTRIPAFLARTLPPF